MWTSRSNKEENGIGNKLRICAIYERDRNFEYVAMQIKILDERC